MTYAHLGRSGLMVSRIGLGTMAFGTADELRASFHATALQLTAEAMERLDELWPGPGEAPQVYAW